MTTATTTLTERVRRWKGLAPCCGTTNSVCARPPGVVVMTSTGCEKCGHSMGCHAHSWRP